MICILFLLFTFRELNSQNIFQYQNPPLRPEPVFAINVLNGNLFLGGAYGLLLKSGNGGQNWSEINLNIKSEIRFIILSGTSTALLYTNDSCLYRTINGGLNWAQIMKFSFSINDIAFQNNNLVYISAYNRLGKSVNGGLNWIYYIPDSTAVNNYLAYYFVDNVSGFLSAIDDNTNYGMIFKTTNSGSTWNKYNTTVDNFIIQRLYFVNSLTGWAAGERFGNLYLIKTTNSGINWLEQITGQYEASVNGLYFKNPNEGYIVTNRNIVRTTNGGLNWSEYIQDYGISSSYFSNDSIIHFSDMHGRLIKVNGLNQPDTIIGKSNFRLDNIFPASVNNIWVSGGYKNFKSTNGGISWSFDINSTVSLIKQNYFVNANTGFALAGRGKILATSDFGNNWQLLYDSNEEFTKLFFINANTGWVSGNGKIMKTLNGGLNWSVNSLKGDIMKMWFTDSFLGYSIMNDSIQKTIDGGTNWNNQNNSRIIDFSFINANTGWSLNFTDNTIEIKKTINGGINYNTLGNLSGHFNKIQFIDYLTGYLSDSRSIRRTTDGGITWKKAVYPISEYLNVNDFIFVNSNTGWFCGDNSLILQTLTGTSININKLSSPVVRERISLINYPNPFNNQTTINYILPTGGKVALKIYNICGDEVFKFSSKFQFQGKHEIKFEGIELASGIYFIKLELQEYTVTERMVIIK